MLTIHLPVPPRSYRRRWKGEELYACISWADDNDVATSQELIDLVNLAKNHLGGAEFELFQLTWVPV